MTKTPIDEKTSQENSGGKQELTGVRAKLLRQKEEAKPEKKTLPRSGLDITIPGKINHGVWMKAQRQAKGDVSSAQLAFIATTVRFEGEQLTIADLRELVDARDIMFMTAALFGDDDDEEDEAGNDQAALH